MKMIMSRNHFYTDKGALEEGACINGNVEKVISDETSNRVIWKMSAVYFTTWK